MGDSYEPNKMHYIAQLLKHIRCMTPVYGSVIYQNITKNTNNETSENAWATMFTPLFALFIVTDQLPLHIPRGKIEIN